MNTINICCPNCKTKFRVPANQIPNSGKKVRCSICQHVWLQLPDSSDRNEDDYIIPDSNITSDYFAQKQDELIPIRTSDNVKIGILQQSKCRRTLNFTSYILISAILCSCVAIWYQVTNVNLKSKSFVKITNIERNQDKITYKLINSSDRNLLIPFVKVSLLQNNIEILSYIDQVDILLLPNQEKSFNVKYDSNLIFNKVKIYTGNKLDLLIRCKI